MRASLITLVAAALLAVPVPAVAQLCGVVPGISVGGGYVSHRVLDGTSGAAFGAAAGLTAGPMAAGVEYRHAVLEGEAADPDVVRGTVKLRLIEVQDVLVCSDLHAGVSRFATDLDDGMVLAGGVGLTVAPVLTPVLHPFVSVRGLYGQLTGTILNVDLDASGLALGVEGGVAAVVGPLSVRATAAFDGFDGGLGATPYPATSIELALGLRF